MCDCRLCILYLTLRSVLFELNLWSGGIPDRSFYRRTVCYHGLFCLCVLSGNRVKLIRNDRPSLSQTFATVPKSFGTTNASRFSFTALHDI